jgi:hypothetical protein
LGDVGLACDKPGYPNEEGPVVPAELSRLGSDLLDAAQYLAVDLVVVLAVEKRVIDPGDTCLGGIDVDGSNLTGRRGFGARHIGPHRALWIMDVAQSR